MPAVVQRGIIVVLTLVLTLGLTVAGVASIRLIVARLLGQNP